MLFSDRVDAGNELLKLLQSYHEVPGGIVVGLPRGGVPVAYVVAKGLHLPLEITCPHKLRAPGNPELAIGAITERGEGLLNERLIAQLHVTKEYIEQEIARQTEVARQRLMLYQQNPHPRDVQGKVVLLVDDGLATGSTMRAAIRSVQADKALKVVVAVPVSPPETAKEIAQEVDELICIATPPQFYAVGQFYDDFRQTSDEEVIKLLQS